MHNLQTALPNLFGRLSHWHLMVVVVFYVAHILAKEDTWIKLATCTHKLNCSEVINMPKIISKR